MGANGHATPRRTAGTTGTASAAREEQLAAELEDWATKAALYADDLEDVMNYYSPGSGSPFGDKVDELRAPAGGAKLSVDVLPVSSQGGDRSSAIHPGQAGRRDGGRARDPAGATQRSHLIDFRRACLELPRPRPRCRVTA